MVAVSLIAGIGLLLAGLVAIGFGIQIKEFSFGNTLILAGAVAGCTGIVMLGLWTAVRELQNIARRLGPDMAAELRAKNLLASPTPGQQAPEGDQPVPGSAAGPADASATSPPWHEEGASRDRGRNDVPPLPGAPEPAEAAAAVKPRRNLLFSSRSRKERERAEGRTEPAMPDANPGSAPVPPLPAEPDEVPPASFDDAWPKSERARAPDAALRRGGGRTPSTPADAGDAAAATDRYSPAPRVEEPPPVTVLKSGVVDGMAYSLYSDGSIEAQMPEGMMRFASIDELRSHLDQRP